MKLLYGSQNFGYDTPESDKDWLEFVYPTWEDIVSNNMKNKERKNEDGSVTKVKDIRLIIKMVEKSNFNDLQVLYSQEMYGCEDLKWFIDNRDALVKHNLPQLFYTNRGYILSCLKSGTQKDLVRALAFTNMIVKAFNENEFVMCEPKFSKIREANSQEFNECKEYIYKKLSEYEGYAYALDKDNTIIDMARLEVKRLLKNHLIK